MRAKIVFMGSDAIALPMLEDLVAHSEDKVEMVGIFTQPDRPRGRGMKLKSNPIKAWALRQRIPVLQPSKIERKEMDWLEARGCALIIVMAYGHVLKQELLDLPSLGALNLHTSILPKYRGAAPVEAAIAAGDTLTGTTLMRMIRKLDAGPILDCETVAIDSHDTAVSLRGKLGRACVSLLRRNLPDILRGRPQFSPQDESKATFTRLLTKEDGALDFNVSAKVLADRIRALQPWPGSFFDYRGMHIKVGEATFEESMKAGLPGEVIAVEGGSVAIATASGILKIFQLQRSGGRMLSAVDFLRGFPIEPGTVLVSRTMRPLFASEPLSGNTVTAQ